MSNRGTGQSIGLGYEGDLFTMSELVTGWQPQSPSQVRSTVNNLLDECKMMLAAPPNMAPHIQKIFAGEYDVPVQPKVILDIGANVGAFAVWAHQKWPEAKIYCYEPATQNFPLLCENVRFAVLERVAVVEDGPPDQKRLYKGLNNCGECSLHKIGEQSDEFEIVNTIGADRLPVADFVKIDTEGYEVPILRDYLSRVTPKAVALEWHSLTDRIALRELLIGKGYTVDDSQWATNRGNIKAWL